MVIIHIANLDTSVIGGVQMVVPNMVREQSSYADVGFVNTHGDVIDDVRMLEYDGVFQITSFPTPFNKPDLVVFHEVYRFEYIGIYRSLVEAQIPYIIIPHGCLSKSAQRKKRVKKLVANYLFFNRFIGSAKSIQYLSKNEKTKSAFSKYNSFVEGYGISFPHETKKVFFEKGIRFVYIGRLELHVKGLDLLLKAVKKQETVLRQNNAVVEIYGPDYEKSHIKIRKLISKMNISDLVQLDNEKLGEEKQRILLRADCFIQTSRTEGLPLGPLEALGYGLPCVVTNGVGLGDVIQSYGAGYMCETSVDGISDVIERFVSGRNNTEKMSRAAIRLIEEKFDTSIIAKKTVDRYCNMI